MSPSQACELLFSVQTLVAVQAFAYDLPIVGWTFVVIAGLNFIIGLVKA